MTWFSFDGHSFEVHETEEAARKEAEAAMQSWSDDAMDGGWDELASQVCYGMVTHAVRVDSRERDARTVIMLYRRWQHASDVEATTGDEADTGTMLIEASFAAQDFVEEYENQIKPMQVRRGQGGDA